MKTNIIHPWKWLNMVWVENPDNPWKLWEGVFRKWTGQVVGALVENTSRETFVLVEQFRPLMNAQVIELVAWLIDSGNSPKEAIAKEIQEETGYIAQKIEYLFQWPKSAGLTNETTLDFYAQVSWNPGLQQLEASEVWLIVHETQNSLQDLKAFLEDQEKIWKIISPGIWAAAWKALIDGKISL